MELFTNFDGRISRKGFWMGFLGLIAVVLIAGWGLISILPGGIALTLAQIVVSVGTLYIWSAVVVSCDAALGDTRCGVDLNAAAFKASGTVVSPSGDRGFAVSGLSGFAEGWFALGTLQWLTGANPQRPRAHRWRCLAMIPHLRRRH